MSSTGKRERGRRQRPLPGRLALCSCSALLACSAMGLDEFEVPPCDATRCEQLNAQLPTSACLIYGCGDSGCELGPRDGDGDRAPDALTCAGEVEADLDCDDQDDRRAEGLPEAWDGADNDCDGAIDEDVEPEPLEREALALPDGARLLRLAHSELVGGELFGVLTYALGAQTETMGIRWSRREGLRPAHHETDLCHFGDEVNQCKFVETVVGADDGGLLVGGAINRAGCSAGQLHVGVGLTSPGSPGALELPLGEGNGGGNVARGVDIDGACTRTASDGRGVREVAIAVLPAQAARPVQALLLWLATADAPDAQAPVGALGLLVRGHGQAAFVDGTHGGHSEVLGEGRVVAPRVIALRSGPRAGYVFAYAQDEHVQMGLLRAFDDAELPLQVGDAPRAALPVAGATHLAMAGGRGGGEGLALAWRSPQGVSFAPVASSLAEEASANAPFALGRPLVLRTPEDATVVEGPVAAYAPTGFASIDAGGATSSGGWFVAWVEQDGASRRLMGQRIAGSGRSPLGPPFELGRGDIAQPFAVAGPESEDGDEGCVVYGFVDDRALQVGTLQCARFE